MYSTTFSRLFVYLSVFLLLSSSVSAKPTRFTRDSGSAPAAKPAEKTQLKHDDITLAHSSPNTAAAKSASPKNTVSNDTLKKVVVDAADPRISSANANTKRVAVVNAADPNDASTKAAIPKVSVDNVNTLKDTAVNEARLRDAAANLATGNTADAKGTPANVASLKTVANRDTPNVDASVATTSGANNSARPPNADVAADASPLSVTSHDAVANVVKSTGSNGFTTAPIINFGVTAAATGGSNQISGLNLVNPNAAGLGPGLTVANGDATSPKGVVTVSLNGPTPPSTVKSVSGGFTATGSTAGDDPSINLGNIANPLLAGSGNILGVLPRPTNVGGSAAGDGLINLGNTANLLLAGSNRPLTNVGGQLNTPTPGANLGSGSTTTTIQLNSATDEQNSNNNLTPALSAIIPPGKLINTTPDLAINANASANGRAGVTSAVTGSTGLPAFGTTTTGGNTGALNANVMSSGHPV